MASIDAERVAAASKLSVWGLKMDCGELVPLPETHKASIENLKSEAADVGIDDLKESVEHLSGLWPYAEALSKAMGVGAATFFLTKDILQAFDDGTPTSHSEGNASFGATATEVAERLEVTSHVLGGAAALAAVVPPAEPLAAGLAAAAVLTTATSIGLKELGALYTDLEPGRWPTCTPPSMFPTSAFTNPPLSPLTIDLDGGGVQTTNLAGSTVHFDFQGDGFAERTGWLSPGDGFLAFDANGNGKIDSGQELFGNGTTNGFDVLKFYDGRTGGNFYSDPSGGTINATYHDGVIDSHDPIFNQLKIWKDVNQDGVAQSSELTSLVDAGITSIDLHYTDTSTATEGNTIKEVSTATTASGSATVADVWFAVDQSDTISTNPAPDSPAISILPDLHGHGTMASLHEAMAADSTLQSDVTSFMSDAESLSVGGMLDRFEQIMLRWAGTDTVSVGSRGEYANAQVVEFLEKAEGTTYEQLEGVNGGTDDPGPVAAGALVEDFHSVATTMMVEFLSQVSGTHLEAGASNGEFVPSKFDALFSSVIYSADADTLYFDVDRFAETFKNLDMTDPGAVADARQLLDLAGMVGQALQVDSADFAANMKAAFSSVGAAQASVLIDGIEYYSGSYYRDLVGDLVTTANSDHVYSVIQSSQDIIESSGHDIYSVQANSGVVTFEAGQGAAANIDDIVLAPTFSAAAHSTSFDPDTGTVTIAFDGQNTTLVLKNYFTDATDVTINNATDKTNPFDPTAINNDGWVSEGYVHRYTGDQIEFTDGTVWTSDDILGFLQTRSGTAGNDSLPGSLLTETLLGGSGNDTITGGVGADVITGGPGNDQLGLPTGNGIGGADTGSDTYIFHPGDGADTIYDQYDGGHYSDVYSYVNGGAVEPGDTLKLAGVNIADVTLAKSGADLTISFSSHPNDSIYVPGEFDSQAINHINFDDGTSWSYNFIVDKVLGEAGTSSNDSIVGTDASDTIVGGGGNDTIQAGSSYFEDGDTYIYNRGDGNDLIIPSDSYHTDTLTLTDIKSTDVSVTRSGADAVLHFDIPEGGSVTLQQQFGALGWNTVDQIEFSDGVVWDPMALAHAADPALAGPTIIGAAGGVAVQGTAGDDGLEGGSGNDTLIGGAGGDTYFFRAGEGSDVIQENGDPYNVSADVLKLDAASTSISLTRDGNDATIHLASGDTLTLSNLFNHIGTIWATADPDPASTVEYIAFSDGVTWTASQLASRAVIMGTASNDSITTVSIGDDNIAGGAGDDTLDGGPGADRYSISPGDGHDVIVDNNAPGLAYNIVAFHDVTLKDLTITHVNSEFLVSTNDGSTSVQFFGQDGFNGFPTGLLLDDGTFITEDSLIFSSIAMGTSGPDTINTISGGQTIEGGPGDDLLIGPGFIWSRHDGNDTIDTWGRAGGQLTLHGVDPSSVTLDRGPYDMHIAIGPLYSGDSTETITVTDEFDTDSLTLTKIVFDNGVIWSGNDINEHTPLVGTDDAESVVGNTVYANNIVAMGGDDTVEGGAGDDVIDGGAGNDVIYTHAGNDKISGGLGDDQIFNGGGNNLIDGGDGYDTVLLTGSSSDYTVTRTADGGVNVVDNTGVAGSIVLKNVEAIWFGGASVWHSVTDLVGGYGTNSSDIWIPGSGNGDHLWGLAGDDVILGGGGNDTIDGGDGADVAQYVGSSADFVFQRNSDGSVVAIDSTGVEGADKLINIENVFFEGNSSWNSISDVAGGYGTAGDDTWIAGTSHNDSLYGLTGDDVLRGSGGNDLIDGGPGTDEVNYLGNSTNFTALRNSDGSVTIVDGTGAEGTDTLINVESAWFVGDSSYKTMRDLTGDYGTPGDDSNITGTMHADRLFGLGGDDVIFADAGNDTVSGGDGYDTAIFTGSFANYSFVHNSDGSVTVTDNVGGEGTDQLVDVEAVYFNGSSTWHAVADLFA